MVIGTPETPASAGLFSGGSARLLVTLQRINASTTAVHLHAPETSKCAALLFEAWIIWCLQSVPVHVHPADMSRSKALSL